MVIGKDARNQRLNIRLAISAAQVGTLGQNISSATDRSIPIGLDQSGVC